MSWPLYVALFLTIWWVVLFAVLPFGVRSLHEEEAMQPGLDPGAPSQPRLFAKALWTTIISALILAAFFFWMEFT